MIKQEFAKIFKSNKSRVVFVFLNLIAVASAMNNIINALRYYDEQIPKPNAAYVSLLSDSNTVISYAPLLVWFLPIYFMLAYCDKYVSERKRGIHNVYLSKSGRKKLFLTKILTSFFVPVIFCGIPCLLNLGLLSVFMYDGTFFGGKDSWDIETAGKLLYYCVRHPYIAFFGYLLSALIVFGLLCVMCQSLCILFNDNKMAYIISTSLWIGVFYAETPLCVNEAVQPFCYGYTLSGGLLAILKLFFVVLAIFILSFVRVMVNKDEI